MASRRSEGYQSEVALEGLFKSLKVKGRADGYDPAQNCLEEVKTYRGDLSTQPANHRQLHWAQAKVYGWLMCQKLQLEQINLALVYFDIVSEKETCLVESFSAGQLQAFFEQHCLLFLHWAEQEMVHRERRNRAAQQLKFPHAGFRPGQRHLAESVFKAVSTGRCLMAQAPDRHRQNRRYLVPDAQKPWRRSNWTRCFSSPLKPRDANWHLTPRR